jgi:hypothetical protein
MAKQGGSGLQFAASVQGINRSATNGDYGGAVGERQTKQSARPFPHNRSLTLDHNIQRNSGHFTSLMASAVDHEARERIHALEKRAVRRDREVAELSARLSSEAAIVARLAATIEAICPPRPLAPPAGPTRPPAPSASADGPPSAAPPPAHLALPPAPAGFPSLIVADFPALFAEFRGKRFTLLWRGSRDGFGARDFHRRCDGHAPTLTLIQDTAGNAFGGFTPVKWESRQYDKQASQALGRSNCCKADPSLKSFLFTLKNPHNLPARKFALKTQQKNEAIACNSSWGPCFGDIGVYDNCNANTSSYTDLGDRCRYANDTGLDGETLLTGSEKFTVKEIEVIEIAD